MSIMQIKPIRPGSAWDKGALQLASLLATADAGVFACPDLSSWSQRLGLDAFTPHHGGTGTLKEKVLVSFTFAGGSVMIGETKMTCNTGFPQILSLGTLNG